MLNFVVCPFVHGTHFVRGTLLRGVRILDFWPGRELYFMVITPRQPCLFWTEQYQDSYLLLNFVGSWIFLPVLCKVKSGAHVHGVNTTCLHSIHLHMKRHMGMQGWNLLKSEPASLLASCPSVKRIEKFSRVRSRKAMMIEDFRKTATFCPVPPPPLISARHGVRPSPRTARLLACYESNLPQNQLPPTQSSVLELFARCQKRRLKC